MNLPLRLVENVYRSGLGHRPEFLVKQVPEAPSSNDLVKGLLLVEIRGGYLKWAHLSCPKCGEHVQLPLTGSGQWSVKIDLLCRPTIKPSIWEKASCGAHFFITKGRIRWCG